MLGLGEERHEVLQLMDDLRSADVEFDEGDADSLRDAVTEAVRQRRFEPGQRDGAPVPVLATIEVNFRLL